MMEVSVRHLPARPRKLVRVNTRLFEADVSELRRRALVEGGRWQVLLRKIVRDALRAKDGGML